MDRTLIPNGSAPEHPAARQVFAAFCRLPEIILVYVTGRSQDLVKQAIQHFELPEPDFAITDVGTVIYQVSAGQWQEMADWAEHIASDWQGKNRRQLQQMLDSISELRLQEEHKQNTFKLSYYLPLTTDQAAVIDRAADRLRSRGVEASLIWSVDEVEQIGLLDVLPRNATKLHGIQFLQRKLGYLPKEVIFAGDSGNDLPVLGSPVPSVLVANASAEVKLQAQQLAARNGQEEALYLARKDGYPLGGNYAAGILQGICYFAPEFRDLLSDPECLP